VSRALSDGPAAGDAWRVGVTVPGQDYGGPVGPKGAQPAPVGFIAAALRQRNKIRPALMTVAAKVTQASASQAAPPALPAAAGGAVNSSEAAAEEHLTLEVTLWRADALVGSVEVDRGLAVTRADEAAGLLFGVDPGVLLKRDMRRCVRGCVGLCACI